MTYFLTTTAQDHAGNEEQNLLDFSSTVFSGMLKGQNRNPSSDSPLQAFLRHQKNGNDRVACDGSVSTRSTHSCSVISNHPVEDGASNDYNTFEDSIGSLDFANALKLEDIVEEEEPFLAWPTSLNNNNDNEPFRDAVDLALKLIDDQSILDLDDVDEFYSDDGFDGEDEPEPCQQDFSWSQLTGDRPMSVTIQGMETLKDCPIENMNSSLGSLSAACTQLDVYMERTAKSREMLQRLSSSQDGQLGSFSSHSYHSANSLGSTFSSGSLSHHERRHARSISKRELKKKESLWARNVCPSGMPQKEIIPTKARTSIKKNHHLCRRLSDTKSTGSSPLVSGIAPINWDLVLTTSAGGPSTSSAVVLR